MACSLTGKRDRIYSRLRAQLVQREEAMKRYGQLLDAMERSAGRASGDRLFSYAAMEKELLERLEALGRVIDPLRAAVELSPEQAKELRSFESGFEGACAEALRRQRGCREQVRRELTTLARRIASLKAIPSRPPAFSRVEEPSRLDISG